MPSKSTQLSPNRLAKLQGNATFVATLAKQLDAAADANDQAATESNLKRLQSVLGAIAALYPAGALE